MIIPCKDAVAATCILLLGGCGLYIPRQHEFYETKSNDTDFINVIMNNVKCELRNAYVVIKGAERGKPNPRVDWIDGWGAKSELKFTTDELGTIGPGALFNPPPPFSLGIGLSASTHATRVEDAAVTYAFADLWREAQQAARSRKEDFIKIQKCDNQNGILIQSDLDIEAFLFKYVSLTTIPGTVLPDDQNVLYNTLSYSATFVASYDANITPTWTFRHVAVNNSGKLIDASRTKTSNLTITFAVTNPAQSGTPATPGTAAVPPAPANLSAEGELAHLAAMIGQAVATATQANSH